MSTLARKLHAFRGGEHALPAGASLPEAFWFTLSFLLFLALGPFSAVAVLFSLGSLATPEAGEPEPLNP
ncbi:hypothetical protein G3N55_12060 [Dissulfurirhabdus thermomarina]|uniref:Uncharacterized protein n=1 Tax=Dissulfurirhabdus thermomarina TaxID=1765737 RepID=A0A6N9TR69_DISTH|nr:hypothetical protein [Dissulfurirhabdus thermomarina]NDY43568.1 hypothetical protein [Dissulfurirhabdus thermomarina]NMX24546.1 hypothetical protein [Dissulfurirhabdus thermomarina]